jgi:hypothetical protein
VRTYVCDLCGDLDDLVRIAAKRLATLATRLTAFERGRYLRG